MGERAGLYKEADDLGVRIDPSYASREAQEGVAKVAENPYMKPKAEKMQDFLDLGGTDKMSMQKASDVKTSLYDALPDSAFTVNGQLTGDGQKMLKDLSRGYKTEIESAGNFARPGLGDEIEAINKEAGAYLNAAKPTRKEIIKEGNKDLLTQTKMGAFFLNPMITAGMYGGQLLNATPVRTGAGLMLNRLGAGGVADVAARRGVWDLLNESEQEKLKKQLEGR